DPRVATGGRIWSSAVWRLHLGRDDAHVAQRAVGDEGLRTVDHIVIPVSDRGALDPREIGARARLRHGDGGDDLTAGAAWQVALLLLRGTELVDVGHHDVAVQAHGEARLIGPRQLLDHDAGVEEVPS